MAIRHFESLAILSDKLAQLFEKVGHTGSRAIVHQLGGPAGVERARTIARFAALKDPVQTSKPGVQVDRFNLGLDRQKASGVRVSDTNEFLDAACRHLRGDAGADPLRP